MNLSNSKRRVNDAAADSSSQSREVHVSAVTIPIIREPSFKSELRIPVASVRKDRRRPVTPTPPPTPLRSEELGSASDLTAARRPPTGASQKSLMGRLGKRLSRDNIRLDMRRSSESLHQRSEDTLSLKSFREGTLSPFVNMSPVWFRKKFVERQESQRRQVMCKDLGGCDCEGWLWKKREGVGNKSKKWGIRWFELHRKKLRYYKHEDDGEPIGVIHLPGLKISPAPEVKSKKYAFKAHHSGTTFFFAAENRDDMVKWMNKMGLASLETLDLNRSCTTAGFLQAESPFSVDADISDSNSRSDSDVDSIDSLGSCLSSRPNSGRSSYAGSREDIVDFYNKLYDANIAPDGSNIKEKRSTAFFTSIGRTQDEQRVYQRYLTLRRTLQDKEDQLRAISSFLQTNPIRSTDIESFMKTNEHIFSETEETAKLENNRSTNEGILEEGEPTNIEISAKCESSNLLIPPKLSSDR